MSKLRDTVLQPAAELLDSIQVVAQGVFILGTLTGIAVFLSVVAVPYTAGYTLWSLFSRES